MNWTHESPESRLKYALTVQRLKKKEKQHAPFPASKPGENAHETNR